MNKLFSIIVLCFLSGACFGEPAITGPKTVKEYTLITLKVEGLTKGSKVTWAVDGAEASYKVHGECVDFTGPPGEYKITLFGADFDTKDVFLLTYNVTIQPRVPPPVPIPPIPPDDKKDPAPVSGKAFVVIIEETSDAAKDRGKYISNKDLQDYVRNKGWKFEIADKDVVDKDGNTPKDIKPYIDRANTKQLPYVYLVTDKGKVCYEAKLPATPQALLTELRKAGG